MLRTAFFPLFVYSVFRNVLVGGLHRVFLKNGRKITTTVKR